MIITELRRAELDKNGLGGLEPPPEVLTALQRLDSKLELIWNRDHGQWEIYRNKHTDVLHWQMSAPNKGSTITPGIASWLQQYDSNPQGMVDAEDMKSSWLKMWNNQREKLKLQETKAKEDLYYEWTAISDYFVTGRTIISVPVTVGYNKRTGKHLRMAKL